MRIIRRNEQIINKKETDEGIENADTRGALIHALIPIGLKCVNVLLQQEVEQLAGPRYSLENFRYKIRRLTTRSWGISMKLRLE